MPIMLACFIAYRRPNIPHVGGDWRAGQKSREKGSFLCRMIRLAVTHLRSYNFCGAKHKKNQKKIDDFTVINGHFAERQMHRLPSSATSPNIRDVLVLACP
jgi:hypothetical protein